MIKSRIVVVGFGRWGRYCHSHLIQLTPALELAGVVSGDAAKRAIIQDEFQVHAYHSLDEVLQDSSVDAVALATPNDTHAEMAIRALEAGKHVVTDKIMCLTLEDCDRMIAAARSNQKVLTVFQNRRWDGDFLTLQQLIQDGGLGDLRWLEMAWQTFGAWGGWRGLPERGGGKFFDLGPHLIDQILLLMPSPVTSVYYRTHHDQPESVVASEDFLFLEFASGATAIMDLSSMAAISKPRFYARGTKATWQKYGLDPQENALMAGDIRTSQESADNYGTLAGSSFQRKVPTLEGRWQNFYENFAATIQGREAARVDLSEARRVMEIFEVAAQSRASGQLVRCQI